MATPAAAKTETELASGQAVEDTASSPKAGNDEATSLSQKWTDLINALRRPIMKVLLAITKTSATYPKTTIVSIITFSTALIAIGIFTNFYLEVDEGILFTPVGSKPLAHNEWIEDVSGFDLAPRDYLVLIHADGENVVSLEGTNRMFTALDTIRNTTGYDDVCAKSPRDGDCDIVSVTQFWNNSAAIYESSTTSEADLINRMSAERFPDDVSVDRSTIFGKGVFDDNDQLVSAQSYFSIVRIPEVDEAEGFEADSIERMLDLKDAWEADSSTIFHVEIFASRSFADEFERAIVTDIPLVPAVFTIMSIFCCIVFFRRDWVYSRSLLGFGATVCVLLSIMTGYGLLFTIGIPFTSMTQILPFIIFGIGLDDAFIISGAYARTDKTKSPEDRIQDTMEEVGLSVLLTTVTSVVAFGLGSLSSIPAVIWLCQFAFPTIFFDFLYQLTFFVALIIIDERRVAEKRRDWLVCLTVKDRVDSDEVDSEPAESSFDRFMGWFAEQLFRPWVQALVLLAFTGLLVGNIFSALQLSQEFQFTDVVPADSYVADFWDNFDMYTRQSGLRPQVYFRDVDQSDPMIRQQMLDYVEDLVAMDQVSDPPVYFWLRDFNSFVNSSSSVQNLAFNDQVSAFLEVPLYNELYADDIVIDASGKIVASRTQVTMDNVSQEDVVDQVDALETQREVTAAQPVNVGKKDFAFFTFDSVYFIWEFYSATPNELVLTTILGVVAVTAIAFLFIPHWTAALFVCPFIVILYVDLLGVLQFAGIKVNSVSYISLVMSIGLLVDFLMHVLLRYYESPMDGRKAKVKDTLKTMGSSILIGGISTFLGVIPLAFSTSTVFNTIFVTFIGLVTLGAGHGLILLPVVLSILGPNACVRPDLVEAQAAIDAENVDQDAVVEKDSKEEKEQED